LSDLYIQISFLEVLVLVNDADDCDGPHDKVFQQSCSNRQSKKQGQTYRPVDPAKMSSIIYSEF
jgi:hypothetical protein